MKSTYGHFTPAPQYQSLDGSVGALQIEDISQSSPRLGAILIPEDKRYEPFFVTAEFMNTFTPQVGGYYIEDDKTYLPQEEFEKKYLN